LEESLIILETERLIPRHQQPSDVAALVELWSDPEVTDHMGGPRERAQLLSAFEETGTCPMAETYDLWPVVEKDSGEVVGHCGLLEKEVQQGQEIELIFVIRRASWGRGYATEVARAIKRHAFERLVLRRLIALIEPGNLASERVAIKVGMRLEKEIVRPGGALRLLYVVEAADDRGTAWALADRRCGAS